MSEEQLKEKIESLEAQVKEIKDKLKHLEEWIRRVEVNCPCLVS